jgi:hypothetical protein
MNRVDLIDIMAQAIRAAPEVPPVDAAEQAAKATGMRRALYMSYRLDQRANMIRRARRLAKEGEKG